MKPIYEQVLFERNYITAHDTEVSEDWPMTVCAIASLFGIRIIKGEKLAKKEMIRFISKQIGTDVPAPFYRGFPDTVRELTPDQLLFDQVFHYYTTYGTGHFEEQGHSLFEDLVERSAFREETAVRDFSILTEEEAEEKLAEIINNLLQSSRPLNDEQYSFVLTYLQDHSCEVQNCKSKNTAIRLLADTRDMQFVRFLMMSDVIKLVDEINYRSYGNENIKKLNLKNQDRKFITAVIRKLIEERKCDIRTCCEKKAVWNGLLHHIHYQPHDELSGRFLACIRGKENLSVYSDFEQAMEKQDIRKAVSLLKEKKSSSAVLRSLNYLISRCTSEEDIRYVLDNIDSSNVIVLIQLLMQYAQHGSGPVPRDFIFTRHNKLKVHHETEKEYAKRRSVISDEYATILRDAVTDTLQKNLKDRLGRVYIDPAMKQIALPVQENTSQSGPGVLPRGSRIAIEPGKKIRAFTYWEKVHDIDLSVIGLDKDRKQTEFSWRTMFGRQSSAITYSGDETSGYHGGSEYFDIDVNAFRQRYPAIRHLVFCDNVFSRIHFDRCFCKAGYMTRDIQDSGQIFEPKTVQSSYVINCRSTFAYLFGIDLEKNEFVWLNMARSGSTIVAGASPLGFLTRYFDITDVINMYSFFVMMAREIVNSPQEADVIVSDQTKDHIEGKEVIRSCDFDKVLALMNQ